MEGSHVLEEPGLNEIVRIGADFSAVPDRTV